MRNLLKEKSNYIHIAVMILGAIFVMLPIFHTNLWFDEAYSVGMANKSFLEIWTIGGNDVHPILYYWMLKIVSILTGGNILFYRIFSSLGLILLSVIGYTHIRKDFGNRVGFFFSFLVLFLPTNLVYAGEIRMYTWAMLIVTLMSIYAYRIIKDKGRNANWILFAFFSLASSYIHYYGLMAAGIINACLFFYFVLESKKEKKITISLKKFTISAIIQVLLYIPWLFYFMLQLGQVSNHQFWISFKFPDSVLDMLAFQFTGNLDISYVSKTFALCFCLFFVIFIGYVLYRNKKSSTKEERKEIQPEFIAIAIYFLVILAAILISSIINQPIIYARYLLVVTGLFIFFLAKMMSKCDNKYITIVVCFIILAISLYMNMKIVQINYDESNQELNTYLEEKIKPEDLLVFGNEENEFGSGFSVCAKFPNNTKYFYNKRQWGNIEKSYQAFGPNFKIVYDLKDLENYHGRIWFINTDNSGLYEEASLDNTLELLEQEKFEVMYQKYRYSFTLVHKK